MNTSERLLGYYDFDESVVGRIAEVAEYQNRYSFSELADQMGVSEGARKVPVGDDGRYLEVLEFAPAARQETDSSHARVYNISMGNRVTKPLTMNLMRLFGVDPTTRLILIGNPSGPGHASGVVSREQARTMRKDHTLRPAAEPVLDYLGKSAVLSSDELGFSYSADKAAVISSMAPERGHTVTRGVFVEPVSVEEQTKWSLAARFARTAEHLQEYIALTDSEPYSQLRQSETGLKGQLGLLSYGAGLLRTTNRAIWSVLASGGYTERLQAAVEANPDAKFTTAWGTSSELVDDRAMLEKATEFQRDHPLGDHTSYIRLRGMHHAGGDFIDLHTAIFWQALNT